MKKDLFSAADFALGSGAAASAQVCADKANARVRPAIDALEQVKGLLDDPNGDSVNLDAIDDTIEAALSAMGMSSEPPAPAQDVEAAQDDAVNDDVSAP